MEVPNKYLLDELNIGSIWNMILRVLTVEKNIMMIKCLYEYSTGYAMLGIQVGVLLIEEIQYVAQWLKDNRNYWR